MNPAMPPKPKPKPKLTIAFDLYGTLLSTSSISDDLANHFGKEKGDLIASKWRQYQLEYTWRLTAMAGPTVPYLSFEKLTRAALLHAVNEAGLHCPDAKADELMRAYDSLATFADVLPALKRLRAEHDDDDPSSEAAAGRRGVDAVVFSNGTPEMLASSVATSPTLKLFHYQPSDGGGQPLLFRRLISVDAVGKYKPAREVYEFLQREAVAGPDGHDVGGYKAQAAVWLVSANPFDVVGARAAGMRAAWVDRQGTGWVDRLGDVITEFGGQKQDLKPTIVVQGVDEAVEKILDIGV